MNSPDTASPRVVEVIQADRDLAERIVSITRGYGVKLPNDDDSRVQAAARHRLSASASVSVVPEGWPDIGDDPLKGPRPDDRHEAAYEAVRAAYVKQQPGVPDQTALVWRWHLGALLECHVRLRAILARDTTTPAPAHNDGVVPADVQKLIDAARPFAWCAKLLVDHADEEWVEPGSGAVFQAGNFRALAAAIEAFAAYTPSVQPSEAGEVERLRELLRRARAHIVADNPPNVRAGLTRSILADISAALTKSPAVSGDLEKLAERVEKATGADPRAVYFDPTDIVRPDLNERPWPKACGDCAFRAGDPQHLGADVLALLKTDVIDGEVEFYCVHRLTTRRCHRVCASAAALRARALSPSSNGEG